MTRVLMVFTLFVSMLPLTAAKKSKPLPSMVFIGDLCLLDLKWEHWYGQRVRGVLYNASHTPIKSVMLSFTLKFDADIKGTAFAYLDTGIPPGARWAFTAEIAHDATLSDGGEISYLLTSPNGNQIQMRDSFMFWEPLFNPASAGRRWWEKHRNQ